MIRLITPAAVAMAIVASCPAQAAPRSPTDAAHRGRDTAETVCSACHQVGPSQQFPPTLDPPAASFQSIADRPTTTLAGLKRFMAHTKWDEHTLPMTMPNMMLTAEQQDTVARYILSLRTPPGR